MSRTEKRVRRRLVQAGSLSVRHESRMRRLTRKMKRFQANLDMAGANRIAQHAHDLDVKQGGLLIRLGAERDLRGLFPRPGLEGVTPLRAAA